MAILKELLRNKECYCCGDKVETTIKDSEISSYGFICEACLSCEGDSHLLDNTLTANSLF
jgi:hypothetical protein